MFHKNKILLHSLLLFYALFLCVFLFFPVLTLLSKSFFDGDGNFVGLTNFISYLSEGGFAIPIANSLYVAFVSSTLATLLSFLFAFCLNRTKMHGKNIFQMISFVPILTPSLLAAISIIYLFGNQGIFKFMMGDTKIYGDIGIIISMLYYLFPHTLIIQLAALASVDGRLYEAASILKAGRIKKFFTITLPFARYGVISSYFVAFTLSITDFGIPKVIGGNYPVLATDMYKKVVGQQDFAIGAVVGIILIIPGLLSYFINSYMRKRQQDMLSDKSVIFKPKKDAFADWAAFAFCSFVSLLILGIIGMAIYASLARGWPYDLSLTLDNYNFNSIMPGVSSSYFNSLILAFGTAIFGTPLVFFGAFLVEKTKGNPFLRNIIHFGAIITLAIPGLTLGISYIFFFIPSENPLNFLYGTIALLVCNTTVHFYAVTHLSSITALKQLDSTFEEVSASLNKPFYANFFNVYKNVCFVNLLYLFVYLFVNALTTVSAVVFIYQANSRPASIAILNLDDSGELAAAAALCVVIFLTALLVKSGQVIIENIFVKKYHVWKNG